MTVTERILSKSYQIYVGDNLHGGSDYFEDTEREAVLLYNIAWMQAVGGDRDDPESIRVVDFQGQTWKVADSRLRGRRLTRV